VLAVASDGAGGFIGGGFTSVGGVPRDGLAHVLVDGTVDPAWDPGVDRVAFGTGLGSHVNAIAVMGGTVYVGGSFGTIGTELRYEVAAIDATTGAVRAFDADVDGVVQALAVSGSTLYIAGAFAHVGGEARTLFAAVDATTGAVKPWDPAPNTANRHAYAIAVSGSTVYVSGDFTQIGGQARAGLAAVDAGTGAARAWNPDPNDATRALAVAGGTVLAGGSFSGAGPSLATVSRVRLGGRTAGRRP
jgi:trimeric autotransporter adhesin